MSYDARKLQYIKSVEGFNIYHNGSDKFEYVIFHPSFEKDYVEAFQTIREAEDFCLEEDLDYWKFKLALTVFKQ